MGERVGGIKEEEESNMEGEDRHRSRVRNEERVCHNGWWVLAQSMNSCAQSMNMC